MLDLAIENLGAASREMQMHASEGEDVNFVALEAKDRFEATRILVPGLGGFLASRLESPFRFDIPIGILSSARTQAPRRSPVIL